MAEVLPPSSSSTTAIINTAADEPAESCTADEAAESNILGGGGGKETNIDGDPCDYVPTVPEWHDITGEFFDAVKDLSLGELVHHKIFGLFEAMSAIEMMDPKMDAGMCCNKNTTIISENVLKFQGLTCAETIGIFDGVFSCMVSWLEGHSLAQTLYTCLYLHRPYEIKDRPLRTFCCAMQKTKLMIRNFVLSGSVHEEEDFEFRDYEYNLRPDITNAKACSQLKEAEDQLIKNIKQNKDIADSPTAIEETMAVVSRLRFLRMFLQALAALWPDKQVSPSESDMIEIQKMLSTAGDLVPAMRKTIALGTQPVDGANEPNPIGFSAMVNQRLLPPTFPRFTKIKERTEALNFFEGLIPRIKLACKVVNCTNYHSALNFFMDFSKNSAPCLLSRSILQCLYFPRANLVFGTHPMDVVLRESVKSFIAPPALMPRNPLSSNPLAVLCVDNFFADYSHQCAFVQFIQVCGYNKARQRDKLATLLQELANLEFEAETLDQHLQCLAEDGGAAEPMPYFGTWMLYHSLRAISMYLLSGFELELYSTHEYIYIYWYLSQFLYNWIVSTLSRAECLAEQVKNGIGGTSGSGGMSTIGAGGSAGTISAAAAHHQQQQMAKQKKIKPNKKKNQNVYYREIILNQAISNMFNGYFKGVAAMVKENRIPQPLPAFGDEKVRFDHRFAPFARIKTLPEITYGSFSNMRSFLVVGTEAANLYSDAGKHFHRARLILESMISPDSEVLDIIRVAKVNFVVMNLLANGHKKDSVTPPQFDFSVHKYFPIIKQQ